MSVGSPDNEERRLVAEYETATRHYSWAVGQMSRERTTTGAFDDLLKVSADARKECERARVALEEFRRARRNSK
jgi:hypothetical protein